MTCYLLRILEFVLVAEFLFPLLSAKRWILLFNALAWLKFIEKQQSQLVRGAEVDLILNKQVKEVHNGKSLVKTVFDLLLIVWYHSFLFHDTGSNLFKHFEDHYQIV